ncbi:FUSC family protein [Streptomyces sp. NPDC099050]|uniref:FUSC family protein n=1 Tax=Streptomyces sp. NPDC099050 TaxID=3366100 RepID=UPI0037F7F609
MAGITRSVNSAQDLLLLRRARRPGHGQDSRRLLAQLDATTPLLEAVPAAHAPDRTLPPEIADAVRDLARAVAENDHRALPLLSLDTDTHEVRALLAALHHAIAVQTGTDDGREPTVPATDLPTRLRQRTRDLFIDTAALQYGLRIALCIGLAEALVTLVHLPRSYWVALTVTFVLKPDSGSVFTRALLRALGTIAGLVVAGLALELVPRGGWELPLIALTALALPLASALSYALQTAAITILILTFTDLMGHQAPP